MIGFLLKHRAQTFVSDLPMSCCAARLVLIRGRTNPDGQVIRWYLRILGLSTVSTVHASDCPEHGGDDPRDRVMPLPEALDAL